MLSPLGVARAGGELCRRRRGVRTGLHAGETMVARLMAVGALATQLAACDRSLPLRELASWNVGVSVMTQSRQNSPGFVDLGRLQVDVSIGRERPRGVEPTTVERFLASDSFQVRVNGVALEEAQHDFYVEHIAGSQEQYGLSSLITSFLQVPDGTAPQDMTVTVSDDSYSMEMVVPGLTAQHRFTSPDAAFPINQDAINRITPGQVIHLTHEPQLGGLFPSVVEASLGLGFLAADATASEDQVEITLPGAIGPEKTCLFYWMKSFPAPSRCDGAAACDASVRTADVQQISVAP